MVCRTLAPRFLSKLCTHTTSTRHDLRENTERLSDNNVVFNQIERLIDAWNRGRQPEPQLIIISAGTNDAWFPKYRPNVFDCDVAHAFEEPDSLFAQRTPNNVLSLAEVVRYDCTLLMRIFPHAQIVLLTPMQSTSIPDMRLFSVAETIAKCGDRLSLAVVRQDKESCVSSARERTGRCFTTDGTHTNIEGARQRLLFGQPSLGHSSMVGAFRLSHNGRPLDPSSPSFVRALSSSLSIDTWFSPTSFSSLYFFRSSPCSTFWQPGAIVTTLSCSTVHNRLIRTTSSSFSPSSSMLGENRCMFF